MNSVAFKMKTLLEVIRYTSSNSRNEECWCDSGKKFKNCHLDREKMAPLTIQEEQVHLKKIDKDLKLCLFNQFDNTCSNGIIKAHSVSKELFLRKISRNNKVYNPQMDTIKYKVNMKDIGVNEASVFYGFCNKHDTNLFSDFETGKFTASSSQLLKLGYRALCLEIFKKIKVIKKFSFYKENMDKGKNLLDQYRIQMSSNKEIAFNKNSLIKLEKIQALLHSDIIENTSEKMKHCLITLENPQNILCSSMISPEFNLNLERLQKLDNTTNAKNLFLNSFIFDDIGYVLISWLAEEDEYGKNFSNSIFSESHLINHKLIALILMYTENVFITPSWWDSLPDEKRDHLKKLIEYVEGFENNITLNIQDHPEALQYLTHKFL
ncbi:SEC-C metal-binding domain-containing protein [Acinetobacter pittii]|uniref:SEC-C metal-binding domain-containing protein n=1 Tax=Acinetobacter pittii TaxID=48296 RepID=UPI00295364DD|nr:SEC-C metal-binding domain-containing protein [Acinetobacter pittii]MDV8151706.1 SEC-C metal-binding domain-containing protein [Acinetobacter pittii]